MTVSAALEPAARVLLDFIAVKESGGNYNAYIGHAANQDDISANTINGIYRWQRALVASGEPSSAVGRYQFLQRTLAGLVAQTGTPLTAHFTPALQDNLAAVLLTSRGYSRWKAHAITDTQFAHNLSCEWASLPDPFNGGRSHYDGDSAGNHAGRTLAEVFAMLQEARIAQETNG